MRPTPAAVQLAAGVVCGVTGAVAAAAVSPAASRAVPDGPAVALAGVGWAFDAGKLAAGLLVAWLLAWSPAVAVLAAANLVGGIGFAGRATPGRSERRAPAPDRPAPVAAGAPGAVLARRAIVMLAAGALWGQFGLLLRHATAVPTVYGVAYGVFACGALGGTAVLAHGLVRRMPARGMLLGVLVLQSAGALAMTLAPGPAGVFLGAGVYGPAAGWAFQCGRLVFMLADRSRAARHSGTMAAATTLVGAGGALAVAACLTTPVALVALVGASTVVALLVAPDPRRLTAPPAASPTLSG